MPVRPRFDPKRPLIAARAFTFLGVSYTPGDPFNPEGAADRQRAAQYEARAVNFAPEATADPEASQDGPEAPTGQKDAQQPESGADANPAKPETNNSPDAADGDENAPQTPGDAEGAQSGAEGDQGADADPRLLVAFTHTGGGYYDLTAPWLSEPQQVRGKANAEKARDQLKEAGPPDGWTPAAA